MPKISVVFPIYNAGKYLSAALNSVLLQTFQDFELIAIDDGSNDGSLQCLQDFASNDERVRVVTRPNKGLVATLNEGVSLAKGEYIARMDADDISMPTRFAKQLAFLESNENCVAVGSRVLLIDSEGWPVMNFAFLTEHEDIDAEHLSGKGGAIPHPSVIMRKTAVIQAGGYREAYEFAEDIDLFLRLAEIGRLANLPEVLLEYRQHLSSIGYSKQVTQKKSTLAAVIDAHSRRNLQYAPKVQDDELHLNTSSNADIHSKWAWWALKGGNIKTARKYAFRVLLRAPHQVNTWKLLACALRGH